MTVHRVARCAVALLSGLLVLGAAAQARPKVCLVLSGGGARGAAHVGVLKVLEELRVPIDCITGTSMGSIVGGAYATGMPSAEMEEVVRTLSTRRLFEEAPPRQDQAIRRKLDDRTPLFGVEAGLRGGELLVQKGALSGVGLEAVLRELASRQSSTTFDKLPIPYRAVATDLVSGNAIVFRDGDLAAAMRASMSVPALVAPAEGEGRIYVDGGLTNNLPVDVARAMGADVVIAVNLGTPLMKRDEIRNLLGVTSQMINILTEQNVRASLASLKPTDILIEPKLEGYSASNFDEMETVVPIGEAAARAVASRLAALSVDAAQFASYQTRRIGPHDAPPPVIGEIRFAPMERVNPDVLRAGLETRTGQQIDTATVERDVRRMFGSGDFEHIDYRILEEGGLSVLDIRAVEKSWGPDYLRLGLAFSYDFKGDALFDLAATYRRTWLNRLGAEWRSDLRIGHTSLLSTEWFQPVFIDRSLFVAPHAEIRRQALDVYQGEQQLGSYNMNRLRAGIDIGSAFTKFGEARIGLVGGVLKPDLDTGPPVLDSVDKIDQAGVLGRIVIDQLDSVNFPRAGFSIGMEVYHSRTDLGARDDYTRGDLRGIAALSSGNHTLNFAMRGAGALDGGLPQYDLVQWGGFLQQSGYPAGALLGEKLLYGRVSYAYKVADQKLFDGLYVGASLEAGKMAAPLVQGSPEGVLKSTALYFGVDTPIGPLYLGYGAAADGSRSTYLFLGRP